jgi:Kelch motif/Galactose oxidase, central domain
MRVCRFYKLLNIFTFSTLFKIIMKKLLLSLLIITVVSYQSYTQTNANQWTWIKGANTPNQAGNYGTKGVSASTNVPGSRVSSATWVLNNKFYLFGGFNGSGFHNDLWVFDQNTNEWTWLSGSNSTNQTGIYGTQGSTSASNMPGARYSSMTWVFNNKLYLFGGSSNGPGYFNDLWEYDPVTNYWTWLKGSNLINQVGVYGTIGISSSSNVPSARRAGGAWVYNNKFYLFGGNYYSSTTYMYNDLWEYDPSSNNWRWIKGSNTPGQYGNYGTKGVTTSSNVPGSREDFFTWVNNEKTYIFGGIGFSSSSQAYLADLWEYNAITNNWTWINGSNLTNYPGTTGTQGVASSTNFMGVRYGGSSWFFNNKLYAMGGYGKIANFEVRDDVWEYDLSTNYWTWLKGSSTGGTAGNYGSLGVSASTNNPRARYSNFGWFDGNKYYMMGGNNNNLGYLNDLWLYIPTCTEMTSVSSGDWNDVNTWSCKRIPTTNDDVTINGHTISVIGNCFAKKVTKKSGAVINVTLNGNLKIGNP